MHAALADDPVCGFSTHIRRLTTTCSSPGLQRPLVSSGSCMRLAHRNSQRYINIYIREKKSIKGKILFVCMLFCFRPLYPSFSVRHQLPGGRKFTVSTLFIFVYLGQTAFFTGKAPTSLTSEHEQKYTKYEISES